jgi:CTP-dependent riboflavin kinase
MASKAQKGLDLSAGQAKRVLEMMHADGMVSREAIDGYMGRVTEEAHGLLARLKEIGFDASSAVASAFSSAGQTISHAASAVAEPVRETASRAKKSTVRTARRVRSGGKSDAEVAETRRLQGKYIGLSQRIGREVVSKRFGRDAIKARGKAQVIAEMESYLASGDGAAKTGSSAKRSRSRSRSKASSRKR